MYQCGLENVSRPPALCGSTRSGTPMLNQLLTLF